MLGEQSVKSLRGKEMVDVIFNGSTTRKPINSAETTLVFDNSDKRLACDAVDVQITRRVYRSGEGEYLLNRQPCRLRDIRELFAGTGAATEAYGIIEQGKVDVLLQAPPRERRVIFEEAAGISRFKAKKIEALRRLERVDHNLLRLSDIVDEVEGRLQTVRQQAGKARRFKEAADRLQLLRLQTGWADWRQFTGRLNAIQSELAAVRAEAATVSAEAETIEVRGLRLETEIAETDLLVQTLESRRAENRAALAAIESTIEHQCSLIRELESQAARHRRQIISLRVRANNLEGELESTRQAAEAAEARRQQLADSLDKQQQDLDALTAQLDEHRASGERCRTQLAAASRAAAALTGEIGTLQVRLTHAETARTRWQAIGRATRRIPRGAGPRAGDARNAAFTIQRTLRFVGERFGSGASSGQSAARSAEGSPARTRDLEATPHRRDRASSLAGRFRAAIGRREPRA